MQTLELMASHLNLDEEQLRKIAIYILTRAASACNDFDCGRSKSAQELIAEEFGLEADDFWRS